MANINRYAPFGDLLSLRDAMHTVFADAYTTAGRAQSVNMPLDVAENRNGVTVEIAVPSVKPKDIDITLQDNVLTISGEVRPAQYTNEKANYQRVERRYGRFAHSISLPMQIQSDAVQANLEYGILRLKLPKAEAVKPRKIMVNTGRSIEANQIEVNNEHREHAA